MFSIGYCSLWKAFVYTGGACVSQVHPEVKALLHFVGDSLNSSSFPPSFHPSLLSLLWALHLLGRLYCLSHSPSPFSLVRLWTESYVCAWADLVHNPPIYVSWVAVMTDVCHHAKLDCLRLDLKKFLLRLALSRDPPDRRSSWDYRNELLCLAWSFLFTLSNSMEKILPLSCVEHRHCFRSEVREEDCELQNLT
jgi:hypothetical protein